MRIGIREQLGAVILLTSLVPLAILSIAVWINNKNFVVNITSQELSLTASLKASQIASDLLLIQSTCATITTRILLNEALKAYYRGNQTATNFTAALSDASSALDSMWHVSFCTPFFLPHCSWVELDIQGNMMGASFTNPPPALLFMARLLLTALQQPVAFRLCSRSSFSRGIRQLVEMGGKTLHWDLSKRLHQILVFSYPTNIRI